MVQRQLEDKTVRTGAEELFKARAKERGSVKIIDIVKDMKRWALKWKITNIECSCQDCSQCVL